MGELVTLNNEKKKDKKKNFITEIVLAIIVIYLVYTVYLIIKIPTDTVTVESGVLTAEESATGYIIREETVIKGKNYKNGINQIVFEGERAAKKQTVFRYYGKNENKIQEQINKVNEKLQKALEKENILLSTDIKNLEERIDGQVQDLKSINDVKKLAEYKKQISDIMIKKASIAGENSKRGSYIRKLIDKREMYEKKLIKGSEYIKTPKSGIISYRVDGLENVLKPSDFKDLTEKKLNELDVKTGQIISASNEEAKVMNNFECYIATVLDAKAGKQAELGKNAQITLSEGTETNATIDYIQQQKNGKYLIVFKLNTLTDELISYRKISFNITWWSVAGLKVPNDSILEGDNKSKYVLKKTSTGNEKCMVKVLKSNEKYSIIGSYNVDDLKTLGLDPTTYSGIKVYDKIMLYPKE